MPRLQVKTLDKELGSCRLEKDLRLLAAPCFLPFWHSAGTRISHKAFSTAMDREESAAKQLAFTEELATEMKSQNKVASHGGTGSFVAPTCFQHCHVDLVFVLGSGCGFHRIKQSMLRDLQTLVNCLVTVGLNEHTLLVTLESLGGVPYHTRLGIYVSVYVYIYTYISRPQVIF